MPNTPQTTSYALPAVNVIEESYSITYEESPQKNFFNFLRWLPARQFRRRPFLSVVISSAILIGSIAAIASRFYGAQNPFLDPEFADKGNGVSGATFEVRIDTMYHRFYSRVIGVNSIRSP